MSSRNTSTRDRLLEKLGLRSERDMILHLPLRYDDETTLVPLREAVAQEGGVVQTEGVITLCEVRYRPKRQLVVCVADDSQSELFLRFLHFYPSQMKRLEVGERVRVRGELRRGFYGTEMVHPAWQVLDREVPLPAALTPVYPATDGISQARLRKTIAAALERADWTDTLPDTLLRQMALPSFRDAVTLLHHPPAGISETALCERTHPAWRRVKFDELMAQQLSMRRAHLFRRMERAHALTQAGEVSRGLRAVLPFTLTDEQERVIAEISLDMAKSFPMQRLLQGDVGSGKTVVAALSGAQSIDSGFQVAMMAPTEILAEQHFQRIAQWMAPLGVGVAWLTGSMKKRERARSLTDIESGAARLVIGTHALIQGSVRFDRLGLVIVDEQHRFGVGQRLLLQDKGESADRMAPHQLMMSATPIPRTLAMTYYADLDVSVIRGMPPGRKPVITRIVSSIRRDEVIRRIHAEVSLGRQAYWVCPLITESDALQLQTAVDTHAFLSSTLPDLRVGLVHGRMGQAEKQSVMEAFSLGSIHVLVATTVIEVGVDIPNASLMVVEHAERFGLSQLHQLRGRIGRGMAESVCILMYQQPLSYAARQRLLTMRESTDGFVIARRDLEIRGPGELLGARQSGLMMLRFADLNADVELVEASYEWAQKVLDDPSPETRSQVDAHIHRWLGNTEHFMKA
ncbi:MAG: ATP-dependent DNA helicase RecG [Burkholderiaceae bacterium]|jgi:ATP-dependent DNA helicase RecG|nr:ATP-dependent DNA helicase RecG [Burkholderiaceae bacterium]